MALMDPDHERVTRIGLSTLGNRGFALAGGYALSAHGIGGRPSEDIDLFTNRMDENSVTPSTAFGQPTNSRASRFRFHGSHRTMPGCWLPSRTLVRPRSIWAWTSEAGRSPRWRSGRSCT